MKLLVHTCCGPCSISVVEYLCQNELSFRLLFYNPNIHPYTEYRRRLDTIRLFALENNLDLVYEPDYLPETYFGLVSGRERKRCEICYRIRLQKTAKEARQGGYNAFTTTLLYSKYQQHDLICRVAQEVADQEQIEFFYRDFREGWKRGIQESKRLGMYRQQYCGCLYSERERFMNQVPPGSREGRPADGDAE